MRVGIVGRKLEREKIFLEVGDSIREVAEGIFVPIFKDAFKLFEIGDEVGRVRGEGCPKGCNNVGKIRMVREKGFKLKSFGGSRTRRFGERYDGSMVRSLNRETQATRVWEEGEPVKVNHGPIKFFINKDRVPNSRPGVKSSSMFKIFEIKMIQEGEKFQGTFDIGFGGGGIFQKKEGLG